MSVTETLIRAIGLQNQAQPEAAAALFHEVLAADSHNAAALYSLTVIAMQGGNVQAALALCERGLLHNPQFAPLHYVHGAVLQALDRKVEALQSFDAALALQPDHVEALLNSGVLLRNMFRHQEALERFNRVVTLDPNHVTALGNFGILLTEFKQSEQAIKAFERLLELAPGYDYAPGLLFYERMHLCDWRDFDGLTQRLTDGVRAGRRSCKSLAFMSASDNAADHLQAAKIFASHYCPPKPVVLWNGERDRHRKIRLAYVSPDFREHPVGHLMAGVFERHDKARFETIAISLGVDDQSRLRARMTQAFDRFVDARAMGSVEIAALMREMEVDIAVDLGGYTSDTRTDIFAHRPAPVQVNYLGYPGSMGTPYHDYIVADRHTIPPEHQAFYTERVAYLPDTYLPTDNSVRISEHTPSRAECGLPEHGFVFCSFSHDYKISPPVFDVWMRLLAQVPGSVLWLVSRGEVAQRNLRREAEARGIDAARLIFAGRVPLVEDHLARYRQADLFLDTHPYNAHTTAADALMAGLPVVTYMGGAFPARVAGSLLHALGVPELVAHSLAGYEALALSLAREPAALAAVKAKVAAHAQTHALFDTGRFCSNLEAVFIAMWRAQELGDVTDEIGLPRSRTCASD
ncbi:acetylglucosamine transferase [Rhodoferax koreense]|uniref:protein O-GlcNAc transferase n=1 Tax=Rhodoferax koreensis TaxID=1842727 RepID=A0A1P8JU80_9BURK|nr:tetratricopeptide repeat protein [Rhodoferax koreense]APW37330.1 acetylglucosamine transferase [Rhodoferax koreense]